MPARPIVAIPGPTPVRAEILSALAQPTLGHPQAAFVEIYRRTIGVLTELTGAHRFIVAGGAGTLAMEMAVVNALSPGERLLVVSHGLFGDRFAAIAQSHGIEVRRLVPEAAGQAVRPEDLAVALEEGGFGAVTITHVDTSTGVLAPVTSYLPAVQRSGALLILDGVCATGGIEEPMAAWGVDYLVTTSQKALGVPPGFALLGVSRRALGKRSAMTGPVGGYYSDVLNWLPVMEDPGAYFATPPVNLVVALDRGLELVLEEGLERRIDRHRRQGRAMQAAWRALGLTAVPAPGLEAPTLSVLRYPDGVEDAAFRSAAEAEGALVAGGVGQLKGQVFRVGHMGNVTRGELLAVVAAVECALASCGHPVESGCGVAAAQAVLAEPVASVPGR